MSRAFGAKTESRNLSFHPPPGFASEGTMSSSTTAAPVSLLAGPHDAQLTTVAQMAVYRPPFGIRFMRQVAGACLLLERQANPELRKGTM